MANYGVKANPAIRPTGPVTDTDVEAIRDCFRRGLGVADTARELGLSSAQVSHTKKVNGLTSEPKQDNTLAVEAFAVKARRVRKESYDRMAEIDELMGGNLVKILKGEIRHKMVLRGMGGMEEFEEVDGIPSRDARELVTAIAQNRLAMGKIEEKEEDGGQARALSVLDKFITAVTTAAGAMPDVRPGLIQE